MQDNENRLQSLWKFPLIVILKNADNAGNVDTGN